MKNSAHTGIGANLRTNHHEFAEMEEAILDYSYLYRKLRLKYFLDRVFAYPFLFLVLPFILLAAWIIKLDGWLHPSYQGPVFYSETRVSAGRRFQIIKFRTVTKEGLQWIYEKPESRSITDCKKRTGAGRIILKWYFDEAPQLFNILKGEMSFVGPRPDVIEEYENNVKKKLFYRKIMKAGLFGIPQACKRHPKHTALFERMAQAYESKIEVLNSLDGLYFKECMRRSIFSMLIFDWVILTRFVIVLMRGA